MPRHVPPRAIPPAEQLRLAAAGWTDRQIAARYGVGRTTVANRWPEMGGRPCPSNGWEAGAVAGAYGLPIDLTPRQVRVLLALAGGPLCGRSLLNAIGSKSRGCNPAAAFNGRGKPNELATLRRRGLLAAYTTRRDGQRGGWRTVYHLTPECLDLLTTHTRTGQP